MAIELPSPEEIEVVREQLRAEIAAGNNGLWGTLSITQHLALQRLAAVEPTMAHLLFEQIRNWARAQGWTETRIRNFLNPTMRTTESLAKAMVAKDRKDESTQRRQINDAVKLNTQGHQQRTSAHAANNALSIQQMMESKAPRVIALGILMAFRAGRIWHDTFHLDHYTDWSGRADDAVVPVRSITEAVEAEIVLWLQNSDPRLAHAPISELRAAISIYALRNPRNEPQQWLGALVWDETDRLSQLFPKGFGAGDVLFTREAGRCWMVSMVARVFEPGCKVDTLPVFAGGEGVRKGQALEVIGGKFYRAATAKMGDKDFLQQMIGAIVFELAEMHSLAGRGRNTEENKFVITNRNDFFRAPYERKPSDHLRTAVMAATTNTLRWFADLGPGRRFDPVFCAAIDLDWLREHREQLWAQAVHHWRLGTEDPRGCWWNQPETDHAAQIELSREDLEFVEQIQRWLDQAEHYDGTNTVVPTASRILVQDDETKLVWGTLLETDRIGALALALNQETMARNNNRQKIGRAMRSLGFEDDRQRIRGTKYLCRFWTRATGQKIDIAQVEAPVRDRDDRDDQSHF